MPTPIKLAKAGHRVFFGALLASLVALGPSASHADMAVDAQLFKPAMDANGVLSVESARSLAKHDFSFHMGVNFAQTPLRLDSVGEDGIRDDVLKSSTTFNLGVSFGIANKLTIAFDIPFMIQPLAVGYGKDGLYQPLTPGQGEVGTGFYSVRPDQNLKASERPMGDIRVGFKYQILDSGLKVAAQATAHVPFGDQDVFAGSAGFTYEPKLIAEISLGENAFIALNAGVRLRKGVLVSTRDVDETGVPQNDAMGNAVYFDHLYVGSEAVGGIGTRFEVTPTFGVLAEAYALVPIAKAKAGFCQENSCKNGDLAADVAAAGYVHISPETTIRLGAGACVRRRAARCEKFRVIASVLWAPSSDSSRAAGGRSDRDNDGIRDGSDLCPDEPEDIDQFQDDDGCPELDNDLDGILDAQDMCPAEPEDRDGYEDKDGCPEGDNDNDGVADMADRCPSKPEDIDGFQDDDGCPDEDNDGDNILDADDQCPNEAETINGYQDKDGCPDQAVKGGPRMGPSRVDLQGETIDFSRTSSRLTRQSQKLLDEVAKVMNEPANQTIQIRIEVGVARSRGSATRAKRKDQTLSNRRAITVQNYLLRKGVSRRRLAAVGLGSTRPITAKLTDKKNNRVQLIRITQ